MSPLSSWAIVSIVILVAIGIYVWAVGRDWERRADEMLDRHVPDWKYEPNILEDNHVHVRRGPYDWERRGDFDGPSG